MWIISTDIYEYKFQSTDIYKFSLSFSLSFKSSSPKISPKIKSLLYSLLSCWWFTCTGVPARYVLADRRTRSRTWRSDVLALNSAGLHVSHIQIQLIRLSNPALISPLIRSGVDFLDLGPPVRYRERIGRTVLGASAQLRARCSRIIYGIDEERPGWKEERVRSVRARREED